MAEDDNNLSTALTASSTTDSTEAEAPMSLIGRDVRIKLDAKDMGTDNPHMWAGLYGTVQKLTPFGAFMVQVGKKAKQFDRTDLELVPAAGETNAATVSSSDQQPATPTTLTAPGARETKLVHEPPSAAVASLTNPRRRRGLSIESLQAMASSIAIHGVMQPIVVRPLPAHRLIDTVDLTPRPIYEVVSGERRWRGSGLAELPQMPMLVRDLSDEEVLQLQLVENIEREDLDDMEEAEGFALLREKLGYTVEQIAERIGKGKGASYVRKTMKLLDLTPESREAMYEGHLGRSTGLLVSRYPADRQASVVAFIKANAVKTPSGVEPKPYRQIAVEIYNRFNTVLKDAPFDTEDVTLVMGAGACSTCPKRTGGDTDLFGDAPNAPEACADDACFDFKRKANVQRIREQAQRDGFKVIDGQEATAAKPSPHSRHIQGFVRLTDTAYTETGSDGKEREVTFDDALRSMGKSAPKARVFIDPHSGAAEKVITLDLANKLTPDDDSKPSTPKAKATPVDTSPPEVLALRDSRVRKAVMFRLFDAIRSRERTLPELQHVARIMFLNGEETAAPRTEEYLGWTMDLEDQEPEDVMRIMGEKIEALDADQLAQAIAMAAVEQVLTGWGYGDEKADVLLVESYGIDILAVRDKVGEDLARLQDGTGSQPSDDGSQRKGDEA